MFWEILRKLTFPHNFLVCEKPNGSVSSLEMWKKFTDCNFSGLTDVCPSRHKMTVVPSESRILFLTARCSCLLDRRPVSSSDLRNQSVQVKVWENHPRANSRQSNAWFAVTLVVHQRELGWMVMSSYIALPAKPRGPAEAQFEKCRDSTTQRPPVSGFNFECLQISATPGQFHCTAHHQFPLGFQMRHHEDTAENRARVEWEQQLQRIRKRKRNADQIRIIYCNLPATAEFFVKLKPLDRWLTFYSDTMCPVQERNLASVQNSIVMRDNEQDNTSMDKTMEACECLCQAMDELHLADFFHVKYPCRFELFASLVDTCKNNLRSHSMYFTEDGQISSQNSRGLGGNALELLLTSLYFALFWSEN